MWVVSELVISKRYLVGDSERVRRGGRLRESPILV